MSTSKYEAFVKTVELGSLTKAGEALGYTQSGISHMISTLEVELGFPLLKRSRAGVRLTPEGEAVLPAIRGILNSSEQLKQTVSLIHGLDRGTLRIAAFSSVAVHWLPDMIKGFEKDYPKIEFKLLIGDYSDIEAWLSDGAADIAFVTLPCRADSQYIPLIKDRLLAILPQEHPYAQYRRFPISRAKNEDFISLLESSSQDMNSVLSRAGIEPNIKFKTKDDYAIIAMVESGLGISIQPELLLTGSSRHISALELDPPANRTIALAVPQMGFSAPATMKFTEYVLRWIKEHYGERAMCSY